MSHASRISKQGAVLAFIICSFIVSNACKDSNIISAFPESFVGIGIELRIGSDRLPYIVRTLPNSAAAQAGLHKNDKIYAIDGKKTRGKSLADVVTALRGEIGSQVQLQIIEKGKQKTVVVVTRQAYRKKGDKYDAK